jgi:hypothetical protein
MLKVAVQKIAVWKNTHQLMVKKEEEEKVDVVKQLSLGAVVEVVGVIIVLEVEVYIQEDSLYLNYSDPGI